MNRQQLIDEIRRKKSFLCVGLDPDTAKMPAHLNGDLFAFNKEIVFIFDLLILEILVLMIHLF